MIREWLIGIIEEALDRYFSRDVPVSEPEEYPAIFGGLPSEQTETAAGAAFDVSGKSRPIPWRIRKKELESQHRTKRRQRDEYRESA